mmetsp:Transcript_51179/g.91995  ORF Transcript_51179/g.91995 Transcript_51179/m.91995 type:complete len:1201 (-) Transcript_51179:87-3689(-)
MSGLGRGPVPSLVASDDELLSKLMSGSSSPDRKKSPTPAIDINAIEDDHKLRSVLEEGPPSFRGAGPDTPRLGGVGQSSQSGSPQSPLLSASAELPRGVIATVQQDKLRKSDDTALASLLTDSARRKPVVTQPGVAASGGIVKSVAGMIAQVGDDYKLHKLVGPSQADQDDAALANEINRPPDKASEVLGKIAVLKAERDRRDQDLAVLQDMLGPPSPTAEPPQPQLPPPSVLALRVRRIRTIGLRYDDLPSSSLCYFAAIGDDTSVQFLCDQAARCGDKFFVNSADVRGRTSLHHAAFEGNTRVADVLLQHGADCMIRDNEDRIPLHVAASRGQVDVARLMIGTCIFRLRSDSLRRFRDERETPTEAWEDPSLADSRAASTALVEYLRSLEELCFSLILAEDRYEFTCLHYALRDGFRGCLPVLKLLLMSLFEFSEGRETDEVMSEKRFQAQPGPPLTSFLSGLLLEHEATLIRKEHIRRSLGLRNELVNHRDSFGLTPLHYAASEGNYRAVHVLVALGADLAAKAMLPSGNAPPETPSSVGAQTLLETSSTSLHVLPFDLAKDMTTRQALSAYPSRRGADSLEAQAVAVVNRVEGNCEYVNEVHGLLARTPLHTAIFGAIGANRVEYAAETAASEVLLRLLKEHPECDPLVPDANGWTPIHFACAYGRSAELKHLISHAKALHPDLGKLPMQAQARAAGKENEPSRRPKDMPTQTPKQRSLSAARTGGQREMRSDWLFGQMGGPRQAETGRLAVPKQDRRADPAKARMSRRPRSAGVGGGQSGRSRAVFDNAAVAPEDEEYPSHAWPNHLADGAASTALGALMGRTPAHLAAQGSGDAEEPRLLGTNGHLRCLAVLDEAGLLDMERRDDRGMTPLLAACSAGAAAGARWLLEQGADTYAEDRTKRNSLHLACAKGHRRVVQLLCCWDSDISRLKESQDWKGRRPLELWRAGWSRCKEGPDELMSDFATIWEAARNGDLQMLQASLQNGSSVDAVSPGGWTPAAYAASSGNLAILRTLISLRCSCGQPVYRQGEPQRPKIRPLRGRGPLHLAAEAGHSEICALLVRAGGAKHEDRSEEGLTALLSAASAGQMASLKMLIALGGDPQAQVDLHKKDLSRNVFHLLAAKPTEQHIAILRWLSDFLMQKDPSKVAEMLERSDKASGLRRPMDLTKPQSRSYQALSRALTAARRRREEEFERG